MNVYEVLENSRVYSNQNLDPNNLEIKINTKQDQLLLFEGYEVFNETECKFLQNGKQIDLTLESESMVIFNQNFYILQMSMRILHLT